MNSEPEVITAVEKSEDKKDIEMEEREKMLNEENKAQENTVSSAVGGGDGDKIASSEIKNANGEGGGVGEKKQGGEGMEVKPKKIPIGGIQMPGFFTRSKSKEKCKDEDQEVDTELIETNKSKDEAPQNTTQSIQARIKLLPNPFRKSKLSTDEEEAKSPVTKTPSDPKEANKENSSRRKLLDTIRLPLASVFPRLNKNQNLENQTAQAGLASMETLDDKSTGDDKTNADEADPQMKTVPLDGKDVEKQPESGEARPEEATWRQKLRAYRVAISAFLVFLLLIVIIIIVAIPDGTVIRDAPIKDNKYVEAVTSCGKVEGLIEDSAVAFRGIPYARPPLGPLRFKTAQPVDSLAYCWNGTFLAHNATDTCLQIHSNGSLSGTEDCLTLDVVTPYVRYYNPLPVIVLIGAESFMGGSPGKMRPSARYARSKDVVFVRPNFRLGALGFLALETLSNSDYPLSSGNYGLSDILLALKWVQLNIEHFGGDKDSVTLFGHRAGGTMVTALATIKNANRYFARAWSSSGGAIYPKKTRQESEQENRSFMQIVGCEDAECLREMDAAKLVSSVEDTWRKPQPDLPSPSEEPDKRHEWLVLDGRILREHPATVWAKEEDLPVNLVMGTTAHAASSEKLYLKYTQWTDGLVRQHVNESFLSAKNLTSEALARYPHTYKGLSAMISDVRTVCPLYAIKTQMYKVPFYVVTQPRGDPEVADVDSDIDAILGRYEPKTPEQKRYFSAMQGLFYHYVWFGTVEQGEAFLGQKVLVVGQDILPNSTYSHCAFWIQNNVVLTYAALD